MVTIRVNPDFTVKIPGKFRAGLRAGQELAISLDKQGRLIIMPIDQVRSIVQETFGMWADRTDVPADGITYVDQIRRGNRLDNLGVRK
jgi:hypothetical protein